MRTISSTLEDHFGQLESTYAFFLRIEPLHGAAEGYTGHDLSHTIDGVLYDAESSQAPARVPTRLKLNTDAAETIMLAGGVFDLHRLRLGYYRGAKFTIFAANYEGDLSDSVTLMAGTVGDCEIEDDRQATVQLNSLAAPANKPSGFQTSPLCQAGRFGRGRCRNPISEGGLDDGPDIADYTSTATVTAVTTAQRFTLDIVDPTTIGWDAVDEALAPTARFLGILRATAGINYDEDAAYGVEEVVKSYDAGTGEVVLRVPLPYAPEIGDTFDCERGCDFAWETCKLQPDANGDAGNTDNFYMGFPFVPIDKVTKRQGVTT